MNYKTIRKRSVTSGSPTEEEWVVETYNTLFFLPDDEATNKSLVTMEARKQAAREEIQRKLIKEILNTGAFEYLEERDHMRQGTMMSIRLKWMTIKGGGDAIL